MIPSRATRVLVINPNTSTSVTESFKPVISSFYMPNTTVTYWTCSTGPSIIKSQADMQESALHCLKPLMEVANDYDGFLGACYADHPLVRLLQVYIPNKPVVGIFDASIITALQLVAPNSKFGILTTGLPFEALLTEGVERLLHDGRDGHDDELSKFSGVAASGIGLHDLLPDSQATAKQKVISATRRLVRSGNVDVVCMGGVILSGMEDWVHEACELELGTTMGKQVKVVDQLLAGIMALYALLQHQTSIDYTRSLR